MALKPWRNRTVILLATFLSLIFAFWWKSPLISVAESAKSSEPSWALPMDPPIRLINEYRQPNSDYSAGHRGVDVESSVGAPIYAPADGLITFTGPVVNRPVISIRHGEHFVSSVEPACAAVAAAERVRAGQLIGWVCSGGADYRPHCVELNCLHWSLRADGKYLSLFAKLGFTSPSVLKPIGA